MNNPFRIAILGVMFFLLWILWPVIPAFGETGNPPESGPIRVACVGDSITFGFGLLPHMDYPSRLADLLGRNFDVRNYGLNSATLMTSADLPYIKGPPYSVSLGFEPQIVLIMLGTNDSKPDYFKLLNEFTRDFRALIKSYQDLPSHPVILVGLPPYVVDDGVWGIAQNRVEDIIPLIKGVVVQMNVGLVDIQAATYGRRELYLPDHVHPNPEGAQVIADTFFAAVMVALKTRYKS